MMPALATQPATMVHLNTGPAAPPAPINRDGLVKPLVASPPAWGLTRARIAVGGRLRVQRASGLASRAGPGWRWGTRVPRPSPGPGLSSDARNSMSNATPGDSTPLPAPLPPNIEPPTPDEANGPSLACPVDPSAVAIAARSFLDHLEHSGLLFPRCPGDEPGPVPHRLTGSAGTHGGDYP